uniref:THD domain-containing protein n=1 Tax=Callorhinchus milii TaxID=7868 RepID=A0A4W3K2E8_CALMI
METTLSISLTGEQQQYRNVGGKCSKMIIFSFLVVILISVQVVAASCFSFYLLKQQMQNEEPNSKSSESARCSTHWTASSSSPNNEKLAWINETGQAFTGNCTEYNENEQSLQKKNGNYFVYVQVTFKDVSNVEFIIKYDDMEILRNSREAKYPGSKSVYFGSIYQLREDTKIFIKANTLSIKYGEEMTFFGLFEV